MRNLRRISGVPYLVICVWVCGCVCVVIRTSSIFVSLFLISVRFHPNAFCFVLFYCCFINFQIPAKPNYSLVLYYGAERPIKKESLLGRFIDGADVFRDARFKLIPSIIEVPVILQPPYILIYFWKLLWLVRAYFVTW